MRTSRSLSVELARGAKACCLKSVQWWLKVQTAETWLLVMHSCAAGDSLVGAPVRRAPQALLSRRGGCLHRQSGQVLAALCLVSCLLQGLLWTGNRQCTSRPACCCLRLQYLPTATPACIIHLRAAMSADTSSACQAQLAAMQHISTQTSLTPVQVSALVRSGG